jgi:Na+-transporting methylmalonyl-CoA/oxaloacetate decarboxylase gamma subunit
MDFNSNFILLIIVFVYLLYSFIKTRKKQEKKLAVTPKESVVQKAATDYEKHVLAAVIASVMGDNKYIVKSIYPTGQVNEKKSFWKVSGRQESMNTRLFFRKK